MQIAREKFLRNVNLLAPALAKPGAMAQMDKIIFVDDYMVAYNAHVTAMLPVGGIESLTGCVFARELQAILGKFKSTMIDVEIKDGKFLVKSGRGKAAIAVENKTDWAPTKDVLDAIKELEFVDIPEDFLTRLNRAGFCSSQEDSGDVMDCVYVKGHFVQTTNSHQAVKIDLGENLDLPEFLLPALEIKPFANFVFSKVGVARNNVFFKNEDTGLVVGIRRFGDTPFPDMDALKLFDLAENAVPIAMPVQVLDVLDKANVFLKGAVTDAERYVTIQMKPGRCILHGEGPLGWYAESVPVKDYDGPETKFAIAPTFFKDILPITNEAYFTDKGGDLKLVQFFGDDFKFVTTTMKMADAPAYDEDEASANPEDDEPL